MIYDAALRRALLAQAVIAIVIVATVTAACALLGWLP
jgi:hypothetical protein